MKDISTRLKELRMNSGLSQEKLAEQLLVSRQAVSKWENGEAMPDLENLIALARLYNTSLDSLVGLGYDDPSVQDDTIDTTSEVADAAEGSDVDGSEGTNAGDASDDTNTENAGENDASDFENADTVIEDGNLHIHINKDGKKININLHGFENLDEDFDEMDLDDLDDDHEDEDDDDEEVNINVDLGNIRIHEDGINIGNGKIRIDDDGINIGKVKVGSGGIYIEDGEEKSALVSVLYAIPYPIIATIAFFLLGAFLHAWSVAWILFCTVPVYYSIIECIKKRRFATFAYPVFTACVYLFLGMQFGMWHPSWVIFLTIPVYYPVARAIDNVIKKRNKP